MHSKLCSQISYEHSLGSCVQKIKHHPKISMNYDYNVIHVEGELSCQLTDPKIKKKKVAWIICVALYNHKKPPNWKKKQ